MVSVNVYDLPGTKAYHYGSINGRDYKTPELNLSNQVLIVKVRFANNTAVSKNVILDQCK